MDRGWRSSYLVVICVAALAYALAAPPVPDLAAQVARMQAARSGVFLSWTGWFGGLDLPSYSVMSPLFMAAIGIPAAAALAAITACAAGLWLFRDTTRPRLGAAVFAVTVFADVVGGRVSFALGFAVGTLSLAVLLSRRPWWACLLGVLTVLLSPLAGLFLGIAALTVAIVGPSRRNPAIALATALGVTAGAILVLFGDAGQMPFPLWHLLVGLLIVAAVGLTSPVRHVRIGCVLCAAALVLFFVLPGAVGTNMIRLIWLAAAPLAAAYAVPRLRPVGVTLLVLGALAWPLADLGVQLASAQGPESSAAFYRPLVDQIQTQQATGGPTAASARVEVIDPASHWSAAYVASTMPIARGWDRQADRAANPLFYSDALSASAYQHWLSRLAVGWVALPRTATLDYAARAEAELVRSGLPYLDLVWQNDDWQLYQVRSARPLLTGATLIDAGADGVTFRADSPGAVEVQIRWSQYLTLSTGSEIVPSCLLPRGQWTTVQIDHPGTYTLDTQFRLDHDDEQATCSGQP